MKKFICVALVLFASGVLAACGGGDNKLDFVYVKQSAIYGSTFGCEALGTSDLVLINETGEFIKTVGDIGYNVNSLTYDDTTDKIYATTTADDPVFPNGLIEINKSTGAGTPIGISNENQLDCPAINSAGELFALSISSGDVVSDILVSIDKDTGTVTEIGAINLITGNPGMAFGNNDVLWLVNAYVDGDLKESGVYTIDTTTAGRTYITYIDDDNIIAAHGDFIPNSDVAEQEYVGLDATGAGLKNARFLDLTTFPATIVETVPATVENLNAITFGYSFVPVAF